MSMTQLVLGAAVGFMIAEGVLYSISRMFSWLQRDEIRARIPARGPAIIAGFVKYAAPLGAGAALVTLGVWAIGDYYAAKSARNAALAGMFEPAAHAPPPAPTPAREVVAAAAPAADAADAATSSDDSADPYNDADFKVHHSAHSGAKSLKDSLLQKAETKARTELLSETRLHASRSQYDCEAADRAARYLKAGLDVWGFSSWQVKYFPMDGYTGASLPQCKDIKNVLDPASLDLKSTVAQDSHR